MATDKPTIHEVDFCAQMASAANNLVAQEPTNYPFHEARVEGFGTGAGRRKRKDLRFFDHNGRLVLCGEVKLPGTAEGRSPYDAKLCEDAFLKASNAGLRFFFTWNVNVFVLWDPTLCERPLWDRRVWQKRLARTLAGPEDVAREENLNFIKTHFLPDLLRDLADIISGRRRDWSCPRMTSSSAPWKATWIGPSNWPAPTSWNKPNKSQALWTCASQRWMTEQDWTFVRTPHEEWVKAVDNMAKTLAYVWANRLIFYKALRARFPDLPRLELRTVGEEHPTMPWPPSTASSRRRWSGAATMSRC